MTHVLIISAPFYADISAELVKGASAVLTEKKVTFDIVEVPGAFEIPGVIRLALNAKKYDGFIALGCVIRGETTHYDYVCEQSARGLMDLSLEGAPIGYGILTVESMEQAKVRADVNDGNKGRDAARACLRMIELKKEIRMSNINPSLQKKTAARMAAVQCLYTLSLGGAALSPVQQVVILKKQLANNRDEQKLQVGVPLEPNYKLLEMLLEGVGKWGEDIDSRLNSILSKEWKRERMSPLLIAILQCGIFELFFAKDISPRIVIDEYTRLARSFFAEHEVDFVHAGLSNLSKKYHAKSPLPLGEG